MGILLVMDKPEEKEENKIVVDGYNGSTKTAYRPSYSEEWIQAKSPDDLPHQQAAQEVLIYSSLRSPQ